MKGFKIDAPGPYCVRFALMVARPERFWNLRLFSPRRDAHRLPLPGCVNVVQSIWVMMMSPEISTSLPVTASTKK